MKDNRQTKLIGLVVLSLLLLLAFLSYWNIENFRKERVELKQDLTNQMSLACSEYRDSLVQDIFRIVTLDGENRVESIKQRTIDSQDSLTKPLPHSFEIGELVELTKTDKPNGIHRFELRKDEGINWESLPKIVEEKGIVSISSTNLEGPSLPNKNSETEIIVWKSDETGKLKLEYERDLEYDTTITWKGDVNRFPNSKLGNSIKNIPTVFNTIDSLFSKRLTENNIPLIHSRKIIDEGSETETADIVIPFEYDSFGFQKVPSAVFTNFNSFLLRRISPSILMSILLFALLAITFFAILKSWAKQRRLTLLKNEFVSNMTHELNTPLATIGVALEALENYGAIDDPTRRKEYLDISKHEVGRLKVLVDKVLSISSTDVAQENLELTVFNVQQLVENKIETLKLHLDKSNSKLQLKTTGTDFSIQADKVHLSNVLQNLIDNAIKYSTQDPEINLHIEAQQNQFLISISDRGIGIPKAYQSKIFERFFRVPTDDRHDVKGHGLGLHYVKSVIDQHKGTIQLVPSEKGSTFLITIPKSQDKKHD